MGDLMLGIVVIHFVIGVLIGGAYGESCNSIRARCDCGCNPCVSKELDKGWFALWVLVWEVILLVKCVKALAVRMKRNDVGSLDCGIPHAKVVKEG